ncbi:uncharacterized protein LOC108115016 [Drosophila eugracilis]|uniref:uncharacterized protein LOC108115016 n=1 Tax=Drosophila eugracilis TaxID=29029 RepID=UPI0007E6F9A3|nr:uncharacterized protein LOC108115016 [Drosophila eugracilis]
MGASNSKPHTVQMANPKPLEITRDVFERIDQASARGTSTCEKCRQSPKMESGSDSPTTMEHKPSEMHDVRAVSVAKSWKRLSFEVEKREFGKSLKRTQELFGKPVKWAKDCEGEIDKFEEELIHCYQRYPNEPLQCSNLARQYHRFVFSKHYAAITKAKPGSDGSPPRR